MKTYLSHFCWNFFSDFEFVSLKNGKRSTVRGVLVLTDDEVERLILVDIPYLAPGTGAGEEAGGARDHKQQFLQQETDDGSDNFFCYNGDCQMSKHRNPKSNNYNLARSAPSRLKNGS